MIVGTHGTGVALKGPEPSGHGTHAGTNEVTPVMGRTHLAVTLLSQPQPGRVGLGWPAGLSPRKLSNPPDASSRWLPKLADAWSSNVMSEMVKRNASAARFGICDGW